MDFTNAQAEKMFAGEFGRWRVTAGVFNSTLTFRSLSGKIWYKHWYGWRQAGTFSRNVDLATMTVRHTNLSLDKPYRRRGFAKAWLTRCVEQYRAHGFRRVTLSTAYDGGAVWAHMGFLPSDADSLLHILQHIRYEISTRETGVADNLPMDINAQARFVTRAVTEKRVKSVMKKLQSLTDAEGVPLLTGSRWSAVLPLTDEACDAWDRELRENVLSRFAYLLPIE